MILLRLEKERPRSEIRKETKETTDCREHGESIYMKKHAFSRESVNARDQRVERVSLGV